MPVHSTFPFMRNYLIVFFVFILCDCHSQTIEAPQPVYSVFVGFKTRVTPIYLKRVPDVIHTGNVNVLQQPDRHLSGPGFQITEKRTVGYNWEIAFGQCIRPDYVYQRIPLEANPPPGFNYFIKRKIILDLSFELNRKYRFPKYGINFFAGIGLNGINSGYYETHRIYQNSIDYMDVIRKNDFVFLAFNAGVSVEKKRLAADLRLGYCQNNPTLYATPFLFPEIGLHYKLF